VLPFILASQSTSQIPPLLPWKSFVDKMPWGVVFLLGGGFAMAKAAKVTCVKSEHTYTFSIPLPMFSPDLDKKQ